MNQNEQIEYEKQLEYIREWHRKFSALTPAERFVMAFDSVKCLAGIDKFEIGKKPQGVPCATIPVRFV